MTSETKKEKSGTDLPPEGDVIARAVRQERINAEILKAVEMLGDRLARSEARRDELEHKVKKLESRPRALINLPVIRRAGPPVLAKSPGIPEKPMSLPRLALVAGISAFIVTAGFGLGVMYGQQGGKKDATQIAAVTAPSKTTDNRPSETKLADLVTTKGGDGGPVPFSSIAAREEALRPFSPQSTIVTRTEAPQTVIRMGEAQPVTTEISNEDPLQEVDVAEVKATPPKDVKPEPAPKVEEAPKAEPQSVPAPKVEQTAEIDPASLPAEKFSLPQKDPKLSAKVKKIEQSAYDGVGEAQHDLATFYVSGQEGVEVDFKRAAYWFQQSASAGVANAAYNLGVMYQQGLGIGPDVNMALKWYMEAAQLGHPEAQYNLGVAYAEGQGLKPNMQRAVSFFEQAAQQGISPSAFNLGLIYENGLLGRPDKNKAAEWYKQAALMGHDEARAAWERITGDSFEKMMEAVNAGAARAANNVAPAAGQRRGPEVADINVMDREAHHTLVRQVQEELIRLKLIPGPADGMETPILSDAISAYERKNGLDITGKPSRDLLRRLRQ